MSCNTCECGVTLSGTGFDCTPAMEIAHKLIVVPTYDSTGAKNKILLSATLNQAYFDALRNQSDVSKRWNPWPAMKNINDVRGENKTFEFDDQTLEFLAEGARKFTAMIPGTSGSGANSPQMKELIEQVRCGDYGLYIVTTKNQLIGVLSVDGLSLEPIAIDEQSIVAQLMKKTNDAPQHLLLSFNWSSTVSDTSLRMFDCDELGGADLQSLRGLLSICMDVVSQTSTVLTVKLRARFGTSITPIVVPGLVTADFVSSVGGAVGKIRNVTDAADVAVVAVESPAGTYALTHLAQTAGDVLIVKPLKANFEFACVEADLQVAV